MFVYSACAVGVGAVLTSPVMAESWAPCSLPIIGGRSSSSAGPVLWPGAEEWKKAGLPDGGPVLQFRTAFTDATGFQTKQTAPQEYTTAIRVKVDGLNILNRVTGNIDITITFRYTANDPPNRNRDQVAVTVVSNLPDPTHPFAGLAIDGRLLSTISFNADIFGGAGWDFRQFRTDIDRLRPLRPAQNRDEHLKHAHGEGKGNNHGLFFTALAEPKADFEYNSPVFGRMKVDDQLSLYFGEWCGEPYRQNLTLLRVELTNARDPRNVKAGPFTGQIVIDEEPNGRPVP